MLDDDKQEGAFPMTALHKNIPAELNDNELERWLAAITSATRCVALMTQSLTARTAADS